MMSPERLAEFCEEIVKNLPGDAPDALRTRALEILSSLVIGNSSQPASSDSIPNPDVSPPMLPPDIPEDPWQQSYLPDRLLGSAPISILGTRNE